MSKQDLIAQYEQQTGKKNGKFLSEEQLKEAIDKKGDFDDFLVKWLSANQEERLDISKEILLQEINEAEEVPCFVNGKAFVIIDNKYIPLEEAKPMFMERKIKRYLAQMTIDR
jgi:hypothetical protein